MNIFGFASLILFSVVAVFSLIFSVLAFCGNNHAITEKVHQRYHVRLYRLHIGFFCLGYSLFAAAAAYVTFIDASWSMIIVLLFVAYGVFGSMYLSKSKYLIKDPNVVVDLNQMTDTQIKVSGLLMLGFYMLFPVLFLIGAFIL